jgi:hypothetical protein
VSCVVIFRRAFLCLLLVVAPWLPAADAPLLPPLDGQLTGRFTATLLGGAPELEWKVQVQTTAPFERRIAFEASGRGLQVRGAAVLNPAGEGTWEISAAQIDLGEWFGWVGPQFGAVMSGVTVAGALQASGRGTWRGGKLGGSASLSLREGRLDDPGRTLLLEGISFDVDVADLAARRTEPAQVFTWRSGRFDVVPLGVGRIEFLLDGDRLSVNQAAIDVFGGELSTGSLVMSTSRPEFSVVARMQGIAVEQILFLLPPVLAEGVGRLDGQVALDRDASGLRIGDGRLALREGETADLRLAVKPGWLSTSLPPEIVKYFPGFKKIETGEIPLRARVLEMTFTPLGDAEGRTAWVHLVGGPSDTELTAPIDTRVNVRGPLDELVKIGADMSTDSRLRFKGAK